MSNQRTFWFPEFMDAIKNTDTDRETYHCYLMSLFPLDHWILEKSNCRTILVQSRAEICIGNIKKSYVSFQLSGQIGLVWAVRNHSPNWHQFYHERPVTIFKLILKKLPKSKKVWLPHFQTKKGMLVLVNDLKKLMDLNHKTNYLN